MIPSDKMPELQCPVCKTPHDGATCISDDQCAPNPGDLTVCIDCGALSIFTDDNKRRPLTVEEVTELNNDGKKLNLIRRAQREIWKRVS